MVKGVWGGEFPSVIYWFSHAFIVGESSHACRSENFSRRFGGDVANERENYEFNCPQPNSLRGVVAIIDEEEEEESCPTCQKHSVQMKSQLTVCVSR